MLWQNSLGEIEEFINVISSGFNVLETVYITTEQSQKFKDPNFSSAFSKEFIYKKFQNRCLGTHKKRYVDFIERPYEKSLFTNSKDHWNHIHLRFNEPDTNGQAMSTEPVSPTLDLDSVWFSFNNENQLVIEPISTTNFQNITVLWRYQTEEDFNNLEMQTQFGRWKKGNITLENTSEKSIQIAEPDIRYIHVTFANTENGGCIQRTVAIDIGDKTLPTKWTYQKVNQTKYRLLNH